jgi:hypothetical protein
LVTPEALGQFTHGDGCETPIHEQLERGLEDAGAGELRVAGCGFVHGGRILLTGRPVN